MSEQSELSKFIQQVEFELGADFTDALGYGPAHLLFGTLPHLRALQAVRERCEKLKGGPIPTVQETLGELVVDIRAVIDEAAKERKP